ncbi:GGDEF domain-containing protein [Ferrimonas sediminicola]|uniref:diguanylate cyclase n=1 Tax=Ferrimonas sediminicola TaxID=2569538 RepID=A0A4U1BCR1_9GAMM|nr:GGDEF domain-containing protein [Ferrimonas sediminicola]TKB48494.1 GGDEF domain-containing protein [Ferrimonas sediminicola]
MRQLFYLWLFFLFPFGAISSQDSKEVDVMLTSLVEVIYDDEKEAEKLFSYLFERREHLKESQVQRLILLKSYQLAIIEEHNSRIRLLNSYPWSDAEGEYRLRAYHQYSEAYGSIGEYKQAFEYATKSVELSGTSSDPTLQMLSLQALYSSFNSIYLYDKSIAVADRIFQLGVDNDSLRIQCYGLADRVEALFHKRHYQAVIESAQKVKDTCSLSDDDLIKDIVDIYLISSGLLSGDVDKDALRKVVEKHKRLSELPYQYALVLNNALGSAFFHFGDLSKSYDFTVLVTSSNKISKTEEIYLDSLKRLLEIMVVQGDGASVAAISRELSDVYDEFIRKVLERQAFYYLSKVSEQEEKRKSNLLERNRERLEWQAKLNATKYQQVKFMLIWSLVGCIILILLVTRVYLQKRKIKVSLETDNLTKVLSRVSLMKSCTKAVAEAKRREQPLSLVVFDLDLFKRINDTFGHALGDWVLKTVSRVVRNSIRDKDILGRLGGEEFVICLPNTDIEQARLLSERCREGLERIVAPVAGRAPDISASFGVARLDETVDSLDKLLVTADRCLYQAKHLGRNRVATVLDETSTDAYQPSMGLCTLQAEQGQVPVK